MLVAISKFEALCMFRPIAEIILFLNYIIGKNNIIF